MDNGRRHLYRLFCFQTSTVQREGCFVYPGWSSAFCAFRTILRLFFVSLWLCSSVGAGANCINGASDCVSSPVRGGSLCAISLCKLSGQRLLLQVNWGQSTPSSVTAARACDTFVVTGADYRRTCSTRRLAVRASRAWPTARQLRMQSTKEGNQLQQRDSRNV